MCLAWEGKRISECLCFHQLGCSLDWWEDRGWGFCYKSAVLIWRLSGWPAMLGSLGYLYCFARGRVFKVPDLWCQRPAEKSFYSDMQVSSATEKDFIRLTYACGCTQTRITYQQCIALSIPTSFKSCRRTKQAQPPFSPTIPALMLPIKKWRMKTMRWSFLPWYRGSCGNIQTALPRAMKSNRTPCRVRLLLKAVLLLSGSAQTPSYLSQRKKKIIADVKKKKGSSCLCSVHNSSGA